MGLGGTGGKILKAFKMRMFEEFPDQTIREKQPVALLYVDSTDEMMGIGRPDFRVMGLDASFRQNEFLYIKDVDVEKILDRRKVNDRLEYKIKWDGYPMNQSTWEPLENLRTAIELVEEYDNAHPFPKKLIGKKKMRAKKDATPINQTNEDPIQENQEKKEEEEQPKEEEKDNKEEEEHPQEEEEQPKEE